jgi:hypothetical protein
MKKVHVPSDVIYVITFPDLSLCVKSATNFTALHKAHTMEPPTGNTAHPSNPTPLTSRELALD